MAQYRLPKHHSLKSCYILSSSTMRHQSRQTKFTEVKRVTNDKVTKGKQSSSKSKKVLKTIKDRVIRGTQSSSEFITNTITKMRRSGTSSGLPEFYIEVASCDRINWNSFLDDEPDIAEDKPSSAQPASPVPQSSGITALQTELEMKKKLLEIDQARLDMTKELMRYGLQLKGMNKHTTV